MDHGCKAVGSTVTKPGDLRKDKLERGGYRILLFAGLAVSEHVHLNRFDGCGLAVHHASNSFRGVSAEYRFAAVKADGCRNLFNSYGLPVDIKHLVDQFLTALGFAAYMTVKHGYLRLA